MKTKIITCILILLLSVSCTLEYEPHGDANGEQVWSTALGSEQMVAGAYSRLRKILIDERPMYLYGDLPSNVMLGHGHWIPGAAAKGEFTAAYFADYGWFNWRPYFQVITTVNTLLNHINDVPLTQFDKDEATAIKKRDKLRGEAYFLYAYTYFYMVRIHGDVPLVKESIESSSQGLVNGNVVPRKQSPEKEVLEYLLKNIDAATVLLDYDTPSDETWAIRADKAAALTLKAHVLLWLARDLDRSSAEYIKLASEAESILDIVISQGNRTLVDYDDPKAVEKMFDGQSTEGIFELHISVADGESYHVNNNGVYKLHAASYRDVSKEHLGNMDYLMPREGKSTELYSKLDKRRELFFQYFGNAIDDKNAPPFMLKYAANIEEDATKPGYYFSNSNVLLFRLSECILLRAETLNELGRAGNAKALLNSMRQRVGIGNYIGSDADLKKEIFEERARELVGEGHSAYDRIRINYWTGSFDDMNADRIAQKGYYWPVDTEQLLSSNPDLYQVPFWMGKV